MKKSELLNYVPKNRIPANPSAGKNMFTVSAHAWEYYYCLNVYKADSGELLYTTFLDRHHGDWATWDVKARKWLTCMVDHYPEAYALVGCYCWSGGAKFCYASPEMESLWGEEFPGDRDLLRRILLWQQRLRAEAAEKRFKKKQEQIENFFAFCKPLPKDIEKWVANVPMKRYRFMYYKKLDKTHYTGYCTHCKMTVMGECKTGKLRDVHGRCPHCHSAVTFTPLGASAAKDFTAWFYVLDRNPETEDLILSQYEVFWKFHRGDPRDFNNEPYHSISLNGRCLIDTYGMKTFYFWEPNSVAGKIREGWTEGGGRFRNGFFYRKSLSENLHGRWEHCAAKYVTQAVLYETTNDIITEWVHRPLLEPLAKAGYQRLVKEHITTYECSRSIDIYATEMHKVLQVTRSSAKAMRKFDGGYKLLRFCQGMERSGYPPTEDEVRLASRFCEGFRFETVCEKVNMRKWLPWAVATCRKQKILPENFPSDYNDYLRDLDFLKLTGKEYLFPKNFSEMHFKIADEVSEIKDRDSNAGILKAAKKFGKIFEIQNGEYISVLPQKASDLRAEGRALRHCVGGYAKRVAKADCIIVFVRKAKAPSVSLATAEFFPDGRCVQFRAYKNQSPDQQTMAWFENYKKTVKQKLEEQKNEQIKRKNRRRDRGGDQSDQAADGTERTVCVGGDRQASDRGQGDGAARLVGAVAC